MNKLIRIILVSCLFSGLLACRSSTPAIPEDVHLIDESRVLEIELEGPVANSRAEISGMAWCGEQLILLPQYPDMFGEDGIGAVFSISKAEIEAYLADESPEGITPALIPYDSAGFSDLMSDFEGFEAIAFDEGVFYVTVEARQADGMVGYVVKGRVEGDCSRFVLEPETRVAIQPQADLSNMSDETIIIYQDRVYTIYEANGINVNPQPVAHVFDLALNLLGELALPNIEYRVTDATVVDGEGGFWAINYFYPGDTKLKPAEDQITLAYGIGRSHQSAEQVERLVAFEFGADSILLADLPPIYLALEGETNNWEGLVRFDKGFLMVTDEYPTTILGYVAAVKMKPTY